MSKRAILESLVFLKYLLNWLNLDAILIVQVAAIFPPHISVSSKLLYIILPK